MESLSKTGLTFITYEKFVFIFNLIFNNMLFSQAYQTFNLTPDIGAYQQTSEFISMIVDSHSIYIFGVKKMKVHREF